MSFCKLQYVNTELQRVMEAKDGGPFEVEAVVHTSATYGDRFRPILKHRCFILTAGGSCCPSGCCCKRCTPTWSATDLAWALNATVRECRIVPESPLACSYSVDYLIVYISPTNSFIKKAIDRGTPPHI